MHSVNPVTVIRCFISIFISTLDEDQTKINALSTPQARERFGIEDKSMEVNEKYLQ